MSSLWSGLIMQQLKKIRAMVSTVISQQEGPGFNSIPGRGLSVWNLHVFHVSVGSLGVFRYSGVLPIRKKKNRVIYCFKGSI